MSEGTAKLLRLSPADWQRPDANFWRGRFEGEVFGTNASVIFYSTDEIGAGPPLHVHTYDEIFIVREGRARFTVGEAEFEASAGDILFGPANVPHRFVNLGPGRLETTDVHVAPRIAQVDLD